MQTNKISLVSKLLLLISGLLLVVSIFVPIWRIELDAPQYPEGLKLLIYSNALGGEVEIINGLNHYIGMKTLHAEEFIEFKVLPYIIGFFALLSIAVALLGNKKLLYFLMTLFILFGIVAMIDFWRWEYNYGHNLNPNAAIIVPGMAYQPPLIGFKQLLNFGAYSIPDIGGWFFILSGVFMLIASLKEMNVFNQFNKKKTILPVLVTFTILSSCSSNEAEPIKLNIDNCAFCKMTISNGHFGTEFKTKKGRTYKFDDISCMLNYIHENKDFEISSYFVHDFNATNILIDATMAYYLKSELISSPMGGNIAAFKSETDAKPYLIKYNAVASSWKELIK